MPFEVPASKASIRQNQFSFTLPGDETEYVLPKMQYVNSDIQRRMQELARPLKSVIEAGGRPTEEQAAAIDKVNRELIEFYLPGFYGKVTDDQLQALIEAWQEASTVDVGESSASASS